MTEEEAHQLPNLKLYQDATGTFPSAEYWRYVHDKIKMHHLTLEQLQMAFGEWMGRGKAPDDIRGILGVAVRGWLERENSFRRAPDR